MSEHFNVMNECLVNVCRTLFSMLSRDHIRAVFLDCCSILVLAFDHAYASVVQPTAESAAVWIRFSVQSVSRFQHQPKESEFLAVLEECCRKHVGD